MKLRYYLRGLGVGMVVTALLMGVALKGDQPLSDAEIRVRAMELGMVDGDSRTLSNIQASQGAGTLPADASGSEDVPGNTAIPESTAPADTPVPTTTSTPTPTALPTATPTPTPDSARSDLISSLPIVALKPPHTPSPEPENVPEQQESVTFVIQRGQSSDTVSRALAEAGLVEDASEFDQYLDDNGYAKRISTGTYEIPLNSTEEEIAKIITRSR